MSFADAVRAVEVAGFVVLAMFIPVSIRVHSRPGRETDSALLSLVVWLVLAAAIVAVIARWGEPLDSWLTALRLAAIALGLVYVVRNRPSRAEVRR